MLLDRVVDVDVVLLFEEERRGLEAASDEEATVGGDWSVDDVLVVIFGDNALLCITIQYSCKSINDKKREFGRVDPDRIKMERGNG